MSEAPDLQKDFETWRAGRAALNADLHETGSAAQQERWQKTYYRGVDMAGQPGATDHRTRLRLKPFVT